MKVPFFRAEIDEAEINEVTDTLRSGWLTTGPKVKRFEAEFAAYTKSRHAVALNSATAALHLALEAIGVKAGDGVLVPTMTFAATAEVVRYFDATPILVDCKFDDFNIDLADAERRLIAAVRKGIKVKAIIPVHYGGQIADMVRVSDLASRFNLAVIEDAAHCCPAFYRAHADAPWKGVGAESHVSCYSFYANKCITTGEGGMACTNDENIADRMRIMGLHGISKDAWKRFTDQGSWYYEIVAPGFKYNLTDIAAALGIHQLQKADRFRSLRTAIAAQYRSRLARVPQLVLPTQLENRIHSWHLFAVRLRLESLRIDRGMVMEELKKAGVGASVHWIPLHLHPYYTKKYAYGPGEFPVADRLSRELISLPIFPGMKEDEIAYVAETLSGIVAANVH